MKTLSTDNKHKCDCSVTVFKIGPSKQFIYRQYGEILIYTQLFKETIYITEAFKEDISCSL